MANAGAPIVAEDLWRYVVARTTEGRVIVMIAGEEPQ